MAAVPAPPPPPPLPEDDQGINNTGLRNGPASTQPSTSNYQEAHASTTETGNSWERPIKIGELREKSKKWSLAGDAGLLLYLQEFSQKMFTKTHELEKLVDGVVHETKGMDSKVHNTFNDFLMLSSKQFIENRVYDEEVAQEDTNEKENNQPKEKTKEQLESEILPRFSSAVNLGLQVLDDAFITVEIKPTEESDDEDDESGLPSGYVPDPVIELKDVYGYRPMPHLIGTAEFFHDETVGLKVESDEEEEEEETTKKEESESESESETEKEESEYESEYSESSKDEDVDVKKQQKKHVEDSEESESDDEDLFGESKKNSEDQSSEDESEKPPRDKMDLQAELASKLGLQKSAPPEIQITDDSSIDTQSKTTYDTQSIASHSTYDTQSIASAADTMSVVSTTSHSKGKKDKRSGPRTKSTDGHRKHKGRTSSQRKHEKQESQEADEDLFGPSKQENTFEEDSPFGKKGGLFSGGGSSLFDDEEGDLFGDAKKNEDIEKEKEDTISVLSQPETPTEIKPRTRTTSSGKKIPAGAVSIFGDSSPLFGAASSTKEKPVKEESDNVESPVSGSPPKTKKPPPPVKGLFDNDDDEDDLFDSKPKKDNLTEPPKPRRKKTLELFDDDEDSLFDDKIGKSTEQKAIPPTEPKKKIPVGGVSMFGSMAPPVSNAEEEDPINAVKESRNEESVNNESKTAKSGDLFGESDSLFTDKPPPSQQMPSKPKPSVVSLFDDDEDEGDDLFASITPSKPSKQTPTVKESQSGKAAASFKEPEPKPFKTEPKTTIKRAPSLFDEDDEEDLFGNPTVTKTKSEMAMPPAKDKPKSENISTPKGKNLLKNEGSGMFGDKQDDLFYEKPKIKVPALKSTLMNFDGNASTSRYPVSQKELPKTTKVPKAAQEKISGPPDLFGEGDDMDDLFSTPSKPPPSKAKDKPAIPASEDKRSKPSSEKVSTKADLFADEEEDDLFSSLNKTSAVKAAKSRGEKESDTAENTDDGKVSRPDDLKLGNSAEQDDLFATKSKPPQDSVDDSKFGETKQTPPPTGRKKLPGAVSLFGGIDPLAARQKLVKTPTKEKPNDFLTSPDKSENDVLDSQRKSPVLPRKPPPKGQSKSPIPSPGSSPVRSPLMEPPPVKPKVPSKSDDGVNDRNKGKLMFIPGFNPAALLPGAVPPRKTPETVAASFDEPATVKTLDTATKERTRGAKRRPPSRNARRQASRDSLEDDLYPSTESVTPAAPPLSETRPPFSENDRLPDLSSVENGLKNSLRHDSVEKVEEETKKGKKISANDIFSDDVDDLFMSKARKTAKAASITKQEKLTNDTKTVSKAPKVKQESAVMFDEGEGKDEDDLFASKPRKPEKVTTTVPIDDSNSAFNQDKIKQNSFNGDLLDDKLNSTENTSIESKHKVKSQDVVSNDLDVSQTGKSDVGKLDSDVSKDLFDTSRQNGEVSNVNEEDEDLFGPSLASENKKISEKNSKQGEILTEDTKELPDSVHTSDQQEEKIEASRKKKEPTSIFADNADDSLFSSGGTEKAEKKEKKEKTETKKSKQKETKARTDDDLFGDTGSIFDDIPTKTKEKKKKKTDTRGDVFAASEGDIFSSTKSSEKKAKPKKKTEKATKAKSSKTASIFDENTPNIFDDPLNALGGD